VLCINLMDEASSRGIRIDAVGLAESLHVPVVLTAAGRNRGLQELLECAISWKPEIDRVYTEDPVLGAEKLTKKFVIREKPEENWRILLDRILVSRRHGIPILLMLLLLIVYLTVWGANYPSALLETVFAHIYQFFKAHADQWPKWLAGILIDGAYLTAARVMAVMLPPMAIFFPLFTILEDVGYLPRMAFLLDRPMCKCGGCGKQALTLCMGLGCNAVGITGCRIIDSPRERLLAILTNAMVPCNGRFPTLILLGSLFFPQAGAALIVSASILLGALTAMGTSGILSRTVLRHEDSIFLMEMPPLRRPHLGRILIRSLLDRTLLIAGRALMVAAPAGAVLWLFSNTPILGDLALFLEPPGRILGMNGVILLAFCLALPANELLIPVILMALSGDGSLAATQDPDALIAAGWTWRTAVCTMVFTLFHWPCSTTLLTIYKETKSAAKTAAAFLLPTAVGCVLCLMLNLLLQNFGG